MSLYMLTIPCSYFPFAQLCMSYLFTQQIPWIDILGALVGYLHYWMNDNMKPDAVIYKDLAAQHASGKPSGGRKIGADSSSSSSSSKKAKTLSRSSSKASGGGGGGTKKATGRKSKVATFANSASCGPGG